MYCSPGLPPQAATLGLGIAFALSILKGLHGAVLQIQNPFGVFCVFALVTQGSRLRRQPWATLYNPFGIKKLPNCLRDKKTPKLPIRLSKLDDL
jgi:hypothetical protein